MNKSGIIFQPCNRNDLPDPDTLVLAMDENGDAIIGNLWYDEASEVFICSSMYESCIVEKWAHIAPLKMPNFDNIWEDKIKDHFLAKKLLGNNNQDAIVDAVKLGFYGAINSIAP